MTIVYQVKRSETSSSIPASGDLAVGELALNLTDAKIFSKKSDGTIVSFNTSTETPVFFADEVDLGDLDTATTSYDMSSLAGGSPASGGGIALTDLSVTSATPSGNGSLSYNNATGEFTFTPADTSAGTGPSFQAVASGALANGDMVVINSDGTVSVVAEATGGLAGAGTPVVFESALSAYISATYDSDSNKVVIAYSDGGNSYKGTAVVGTVSGSSISFGTPVIYETGTTYYNSIIFDSANNKVVIAYEDDTDGDKGKAIVGTVSGTSISFGTEVVFNNGSTNYISATYDSANSKVVIAYRDVGNASYGTAVVGTVSGTSISFGTEVVFDSTNAWYISATYDSNTNKVVIAYKDYNNSSYGTAVVGTVSGTSISFGTPVVFESADSQYISATYDSDSNRVVIAYQDNGNSGAGTAIVGTVSGTSISFGTPVVFNNVNTTHLSATYDSANGKVVISYRDAGGGSGYATLVVGTVSDTSISFDTPVIFNSGNSTNVTSTYDPDNTKVILAYRNSSNSNYGTAVAYQTVDAAGSNLTTENFIGISDGAYADGATATIQVAGSVDDAQSGLTAGQAYYVQADGTLSQTPDDPSVFAGTAVSASKLIIKG